MVVARLMPMPNAVPPRCVLVARGAPKNTMITHVTGIAILSESSTLISFASAPDRSSDRMKRRSSAKAHLLRLSRRRRQIDRRLE